MRLLVLKQSYAYWTDAIFTRTSFLILSHTARATMKDEVRINWRQCNTSDTVGADMRKHSGQLPRCKNKINIRTDILSDFRY